MKKHIYPAVFYPEKDGQFSVIFPDFGGATYGNDLEDAYAMAVDYLGGIIVEMQDCRESLPNPSDIHLVKIDDQPGGFATLIAVDAEDYRSKKSVKKTLTIPAWLDREAVARNINFSKVLQEALKAQLEM